MTVWIHLTGLTPYAVAHRLQERLVQARREGGPDVVLLLEHPATITLGRRKELNAGVVATDVPVVPIERGGGPTYHAPGQLVAYPIVALDGARRDVHGFLDGMVDGVIALLAPLGLQGGRDERNTGVWVGGRKVCSVGIAIRHWVTWHGLALNVDVDMAGFSRIRPCGFSSDVMTRMADHLQVVPTVEALVVPLSQALSKAMDLPWAAPIRVAVHDDAAADALVERVLAGTVPVDPARSPE